MDDMILNDKPANIGDEIPMRQEAARVLASVEYPQLSLGEHHNSKQTVWDRSRTTCGKGEE
jgi:hypothetical protein